LKFTLECPVVLELCTVPAVKRAVREKGIREGARSEDTTLTIKDKKWLVSEMVSSAHGNCTKILRIALFERLRLKLELLPS
jgi:hypothetical protein